MAKAKTKQGAAINITLELLARLEGADDIYDGTLNTLDECLMVAMSGNKCYTGVVQEVILFLADLEKKDAKLIEDGDKSWVYGDDAKVEARARALKAKAIKLAVKYGRKDLADA